eukprot:s3467_g1.t1
MWTRMALLAAVLAVARSADVAGVAYASEPWEATFSIDLDGREGGDQASFSVRVHPEWAPEGAKRFQDMVQSGEVLTGARFFRAGLPAPGSWDYAYPAMQQQTWAPMQQHIRPPSPMSAAQFAQSLSQSPTEEHAGAGQCTEYYDIGTQDAPGTGLAAALATLPSVGPAVGLATEITAATA